LVLWNQFVIDFFVNFFISKALIDLCVSLGLIAFFTSGSSLISFW
jgi:hypothetical protein